MPKGGWGLVCCRSRRDRIAPVSTVTCILEPNDSPSEQGTYFSTTYTRDVHDERLRARYGNLQGQTLNRGENRKIEQVYQFPNHTPLIPGDCIPNLDHQRSPSFLPLPLCSISSSVSGSRSRIHPLLFPLRKVLKFEIKLHSQSLQIRKDPQIPQNISHSRRNNIFNIAKSRILSPSITRRVANKSQLLNVIWNTQDAVQ